MILKDFVQGIEGCWAMAQAEDFDNVGLLCGNPEREVTGVLVCHDALETVVDEAVAKGANVIICFHPIIFSGLKKLTGKTYVERAVMKAIENKIAIYAVHTALDNDYFGVNYRICEALGLKDQKVLMPKRNNLLQLAVYVPGSHLEAVREALFSAGAGRIGFYDECGFSVTGEGTFRPLEGSSPFLGRQDERTAAEEVMLTVVFEAYRQNSVVAAMKQAHPYEEVAYQVVRLENDHAYSGLGRYGELPEPMAEQDFLAFVKSVFGLAVIRHSGQEGRMIRRVGVLGGSGASGIAAAKSVGCEAYLTGDLKYHDFFQAEGRMLLCDIGHFESERFVVEQMFEVLSEKFTNFAVLKSEVNTNPVNYFI
ncbi:Nif3-like dinuclear metal center hexameric protein [Bergeyella sp. RCAD1439]|uniref:Nif3-like dinuclear metal center hexameric protein n=1 Tax=Bergeyella anatis TaxID=3113737 RepID=UPI002E17F8FE|nr:Nif3-like dinuclear metal center hexameric protein [Bergeyella sp. RCAD1439]